MNELEEKLEIRFHDSPWSDCYEIAFFSKENGKSYVGSPLEMKAIKRGEIVTPTARLGSVAMQGLFNEMWRAGFRPKDGTGNSGHVEALKYHLEDMRKLVFVTTETKQPGAGVTNEGKCEYSTTAATPEENNS